MPKVRKLRVYSCKMTLASLDKRTREARLMRRVREDLLKHLGGHPNTVQRMLIERAVILSLRVAQIDAKILAGDTLTLHDNNAALAWNNALRRTLTALDIDEGRGSAASAAATPTLADLFPDRAA
jgi:hypothetical protein